MKKTLIHGGLILFICLAAAQFTWPKETWKIRGKFVIRHQIPELQDMYGDAGGAILHGITVKISAKEKGIGIWNEWGEVKTGPEGKFSLTMEKDATQRAFKIEFKFDNPDLLEIRHEESTDPLQKKVKWYTAYNKDEWHSAGTLDVGDLIFRDGGHEDMGSWEPRRHAEIWVVARSVIDYVNGLGSKYEFTSQLKIKYPNTSGPATSSYANPANKVVYIYRMDGLPKDGVIRDSDHFFDIPTIIHEIMHIWAYQHSKGEMELAEALFEHQATHGFEPALSESWWTDFLESVLGRGKLTWEAVAWQEGFAEYAADKLLEELYNYPKVLPYNRPQLLEGVGIPGCPGSDVIDNLNKIQNHDAGWWQVFHILSFPGIGAIELTRSPSQTNDAKELCNSTRTNLYAYYAYGAHQTGGCAAPDITFKDILEVCLASPSDGYDSDIGKDDMTIENYLTRAKKILHLSSTDKEIFKDLCDPVGSMQPHAAWCD